MNLIELVERSRATPEFGAAVAAFLRDGVPNERVEFDRHAPPVKVERTLIQLLENRPELAIEQVKVRGASGCEFFRGELTAVAGDEKVRVRFHWDCKWRAEQEGWTDYFGFPDQTRAAREFGHRCFRRWEETGRAQPA